MTVGLDEGAALKLIRGLHDMAGDEDFFAHFVNGYTEKLNVDVIQFMALVDQTTAAKNVITKTHESVAGDYFDYAADDPRNGFLAKNTERIYSCVEMTPIDAMERSPLVNEFYKRPDVDLRWSMGAQFGLPGGTYGILGILSSRKRGPFVDRARAPVDIVFPHVKAIIRTRLAVAQSRLWQNTIERALDCDDRAVIVATADGRIVYANGAGEALFRRGDLFRAQTGYIGMAAEGQAGALRRAISTKAAERDSIQTGPSLVLIRGSTDEIVYLVKLWLLPKQAGPLGKIGPFVQLMIERLGQHVRLTPDARRVFGLSRREFDMAEALCSRETTGIAAHRLGISHETARGYVKALLAKLGVSSQKDAVLLLMRFAERIWN